MTILAGSVSNVDLDYSTRLYIPGPGLNSAWLLGHALGLHTELSEPPAGFTEAEAEAFRHGWLFGADNRGPEECPDWIGDYLADLHGDDHDGQICPTDLEYWTLPNGEYYDAEREIEEAEAVEVYGHRAYSGEGGAL